jgi:tetratricopeptide (TPR) repeat protein
VIPPRRIIGAAAAIFLLAAAGWSAEVRTAPDSPLFETMVASHLTTLEEVAELDTSASEELADGGILVLEEEIRAVSADATSIIAYHRVLKPLTDAGVELASQVVIPYDRSFQRASLVTARTRQPDGTVTDVNGDAAFVQSPQHQADQGIYTDSEELVVLFSNVKADHLVEYVVVIETIEPRMPGAWGTIILPGAYWPSARFRSLLTVEEPLAGRLTIAPLGGPLPAAASPASPSGWRTWEWSQDNLAPLDHEIGRAPTSQIGPAIRLTTVSSWDDVAAWYSELLKSRSTLTPTIAEKVDLWTRGLDDPREILDSLHRKVADDVRYTGLEFGIGALRPRSPDEVWSSQYGDCKDKANLLRVMLARRGIDAHMVLVNTIHAGRIDGRAPHYHQFNHAILAADIDGERVFCDPTLPSSVPGLLPPSDTGREVLLIDGDHGQLIPVPMQEAGDLRYGFELELGADGGLSGWLEITADRVRGARLRDYFRYLDEQSRHRRFHSLVDLFFEGADLIDVEISDEDDSGGSVFSARGFFVVGGVGGGQETRAVLQFPHGEMVFPYLDDQGDRETTWHQELKTTEVAIRYLLAAGWREQASLPKPLKVASPAVAGEARWRYDEEGALVATLTYRTLLDLVDREEFSRFRQAVVAMRTWMDTPVTVAPTGEARPPELQTVEVEMPMMPTGEGQLRLVDRLFPLEGDPDRRRAALLQAQQLFPDSADTAFDVQVWLAQLDAGDGRADEAVERIRNAIEAYGDKVSRESTAWARYHLAHHILDQGEEKAATAVFEALATNTGLSTFRRATAYEMLAVIHSDTGNDELAVRALDDGLALDSEMAPDLQDTRARLMVGAGLSEELEDRIRREIEKDPQAAQWTVQTLTATVSDLTDEGNPADATTLATMLTSIADSSPSVSINDQVRSELDELSRATEAYSSIAAAIADYLSEDAPDWLEAVANEVPTDSVEVLTGAMDRYDTEGRYPEYIRAGLERLARYSASIDDFGNDLWQLAVVVEDRPPHDALLGRMVDWGLNLPKTDDFFFEMVIVHVRRIERNGDPEKALELLRQWSESPEVDAVYRVAFLSRIGLIHEGLGAWDAALASYRRLEPERDSNLGGYDALLRAAFLNLGLGRHDEAIRLIGLLADLDDESLSYCESPDQIRELVSLAEDPELAKRFWALERDWMPVWESLERAVGLEPFPDVSAPLIPDTHAFGVEVGAAIRAEAPTTYFELLRTLVQTARWQPEMVFEVCSLSSQTARMAPEHNDLAQALLVGLTSGLDIGDDLIYKRSRLVLATYYFDQDLHLPTVTVGREYLTRFEPDDTIGQAIVRLWGLAAVYAGIDQQPAIDRLEKSLAEQELAGSRTVTVYVLARLYRAQGRPDDELELIKTEVIDRSTDNQAYGERLARRYAELTDDPDGDSDFAQAVEAWTQRHSPSWYEAAPPASLDDPLAKRIERDLDDSPERFETTELIKYRLLVARDPSRPETDRHQAFAFAISDLVSLSVSNTEADAILESVIDDERFPSFVRLFPLRTSLDDAFDRSNADRISRWMTTTAFKTWNAGERDTVSRMRAGLPDPDDDAPTLAARASKTIADPLDDTGVRILRKTVERLLQLGDFDAAEMIIGGLDAASFETHFEPSGAGLRLELRRRLKAYRAEWPAREAMRSTVLAELGDLVPKRPQALDDVADVDHIDHLPREQGLDIRLYLLGTRQYDAPMTGFWPSLVDDLRDLRDQEIARRTLEAGVAAADDDDTRSRLLLYLGSSCFDIDDPEDRERFDRLMAPSRDDPASPISRASTVYISSSVSARIGRDFDATSVAEAAETLEAERGVVRLRLAQARRAGTAELRRELEAVPTDYLVDPYLIPLVLPSLREVGLDDEAELVAEAGLDLARRDMLRSWSTLDVWAIRSTLRLCEALAEEGCLTPGWIDFMSDTLGNRGLALEMKLTAAELRQDWRAARDVASELISQRPSFYDLYWRLGRAEAHLEDVRPAADALATFLRHCHDSVYFRQAEGLLATLSGAPDANAAVKAP